MKSTGTIGRNTYNSKLSRNVQRVKEAYWKYFDLFHDFAPDEWVSQHTSIKLETITDHYKDHLVRVNWFDNLYTEIHNYKQKNEKPKLKKYTINAISVLKAILCIIGVLATYMSIYYSNLYLQQYLNKVNAFILSTTMVIYAVVSFEFIVYFYLQKFYKLLAMFSLLWLVCVLFSMVSTVAGQYNARMSKILENKQQEKQLLLDNSKITEYNNQKELLEKELDKYNIESDRLTNLLNQFTSTEITSQAYRDINYSKIINDRKRQEVLTELKNLQKPEISANVIVLDFYQWLSKIINKPDYLIQFLLSLFPAIFIDLIAPISISTAIFLKRK